jgi:hypothetical protein
MYDCLHRLYDDFYRTDTKLVGLKPNVIVLINYPMRTPYAKSFKRSELKTVSQVLDKVVQMYKHAYKNAMTTNPYGIWGHDMGDLTIGAVLVSKDGSQITVGVDS